MESDGCKDGFFHKAGATKCCTACSLCADGQYVSKKCVKSEGANKAGTDTVCSNCKNCGAGEKKETSCRKGTPMGTGDNEGKNTECKEVKDWVVKYKTGTNCKCEENGAASNKAVGNAAKSKAGKGTFHLKFKDGSTEKFAASFDNPCENLDNCASKNDLTNAANQPSFASTAASVQFTGAVTVEPDITDGSDGWCMGQVCTSSATMNEKYEWTATDQDSFKGWINKQGGKCPRTLTAITLTKADGQC